MSSATAHYGNNNHNVYDTSDNINNLRDSDIVKTFSKATVLVTGGTGYLGQLLIEKLLRCCPDLKKIYVLARPKKGKDIHTRLQEQFKDVFYDRLRKSDPNFARKVEPVAGDCGELGLGLSNDDRITITDEVTVIFHSAATVRFNEPLKLAVAINTRGTREMLQLATECKNLKALLHVSTAYSNCYLSDIKEQFYEATLPGDKLIDLAESMDKDILNKITPGLIDGHPNTYTYTKKAAEDILQRYGQHLPLAIVRPSIITTTAKEPVPGWSGNIYGLVGAVIGVGIGLMHAFHVSKHKVADAVPGDMVSNTCIVVASKIANEKKRHNPTEPPIYTCATGPLTPITWDQIDKLGSRHYEDFPSTHAIYVYFKFFTESYLLSRVLGFIFHWIPAYTIDAISVLFGKKPVMKKVYTKAENLMASLDFFMNNEWNFSNTNTVTLYRSLSKIDRELFDFDFENHEWDSYMRNYVMGSRVYIMKEPLDNLEEARRKRTFLKVLHFFICCFAVLTLYLFIKLLFRGFFGFFW